jgi:hypothetical protein
MQASGVQAMPRDAVIDVKGMHHSSLEIALEGIAAIGESAHAINTSGGKLDVSSTALCRWRRRSTRKLDLKALHQPIK